MKKQNLTTIFNMVCNDEEITEESLLDKGFTTEEIDELFDNDFLYSKEDGTYFISYVGDLIDYAMDAMKNQLFRRANYAIDKCYEIAPHSFEVVTLKFEKTFIEESKTKNYKDSIKYLYEMKKLADENEIKDVNTYIFLFSMLTELPDDIRNAAKYFKLHDLTINTLDSRFEDIEIRNDIRREIYYQKFTNALKILHKINDRSSKNAAYDITVVKLTEEVATVRKKNVIIVKDLAIADKEDEIILLYEMENEKRNLTRHEEYILKLANKLSTIRKTGIIPKINKIKDGRYYDMIDNNDFQGALKRAIEMNKQNKTALNSSSSYILLSKLVAEIDNIKSQKNVKEKNKSPNNG